MSAAPTACLAVGDGAHRDRPPERIRQRVREFPGQVLRAFRPATPDRDLADRPHLGMDADEMRRQRAGADHQQPRDVGPREVARGQSRGAGGAPLGQHGAVEQRQGLAGGAVEQQVLAVDRGQRALAVVGKDRDHLHADMALGAARPRRHQQQGGVGRAGAGGRGHGVMVARRHLAAAAEQRVEAVDQRQIVEGGVDLGGREDPHDDGLRGRTTTVRARPAHSAARSLADRVARGRRLAQDGGAAGAAWRRRWTSRSRRAASSLASRARRRWWRPAHQPSPSPTSTPSSSTTTTSR